MRDARPGIAAAVRANMGAGGAPTAARGSKGETRDWRQLEQTIEVDLTFGEKLRLLFGAHLTVKSRTILNEQGAVEASQFQREVK